MNTQPLVQLGHIWSSTVEQRARVTLSVSMQSVDQNSQHILPCGGPASLARPRQTTGPSIHRGGGPERGWGRGTRNGYMKRARKREEAKRGGDKETTSFLSFSFMPLESFPLPPLEETAAPATHTQKHWQYFSPTHSLTSTYLEEWRLRLKM